MEALEVISNIETSNYRNLSSSVLTLSKEVFLD